MGTPIKVSAEGKSFYICCKGCETKFAADPELFAACQEALGSVDLLRGDVAAAQQRFAAGLSCVEGRPGSPMYAALLARLAETRRHLETETRSRLEAVEQLRNADRLTTVGRLSAAIAHELGTPLHIISGRANRIAGSASVADSTTYWICASCASPAWAA